MKLRSKMIAVMALVCACFTLAISVALVGMQNAKNQFENFLEQDQALLIASTNLYAQGLQMGQALRNIILDPQNKKAYENLDSASSQFQAAYKMATTLATNPETIKKLQSVGELREQQAQLQGKITGLAKDDQAGVITLLNTEETPTWLTRNVMKQLGGEPDYAAKIASSIAAGDLTVEITTRPNDQSSLLFAMKAMQQGLVGIVSRVRMGTDIIASASSQITTGNLDLSSRTEQQASSLAETASSMEQLTATVKQNADNANQANFLAGTASNIAIKGGEVVSQVVSTMGAINESSNKIVDIISVIDSIAFQTNILALNAAVEAARAGEEGRGFAVVASEVRTLAQRSAAAAREIKTLIDDSVSKVSEGNDQVAQAGLTMSEIVDSVQRVTDIMTEITAASQEQTLGIEQINQAINQMDEVTHQNAALVEQAAAAAQSLQDQAGELSDVVSVFRLDQGLLSYNTSVKQLT